jgi:pimeloyl-ACP methyl ester carboxylesterase
MSHDLAATLRISERARAGMQSQVEAFARRPMSDFDLLPLGRDGALPPTLVVHDRDDKEVPYRVGAAVAEAWPESELLTTTGLGHQRILTADHVLDAVADHVTS